VGSIGLERTFQLDVLVLALDKRSARAAVPATALLAAVF
jgi:hypothetical protein